MSKSTFYHAGCPVCTTAEVSLIKAIGPNKHDVEVVHLGEQPDRVALAEAAGVKSVPALVLDNNVFHINYGASIEDLKN